MIKARNAPIAERPTPGPTYAKAGVAHIENMPTTARQTAVKWPCFTIHLPSCLTALSMRTQHAIGQVEWLPPRRGSPLPMMPKMLRVEKLIGALTPPPLESCRTCDGLPRKTSG